MTETEKKALALVNEVRMERDEPPLARLDKDLFASQEALCRAIEQHEAFKREVSDAVEGYTSMVGLDPKRYFARFIIAKPDPLEEVLDTLGWSFDDTGPDMADDLRAALADRGLEVRKIGEGE